MPRQYKQIHFVLGQIYIYIFRRKYKTESKINILIHLQHIKYQISIHFPEKLEAELFRREDVGIGPMKQFLPHVFFTHGDCCF